MITDKIAEAHYVATEQQVESMARERYNANAVIHTTGETYLRVVVAACQARLGKRPRGRPTADKTGQTSVLELAHQRFYPAILRGVTTPDVEPDESQPHEEQQRRMLARNSRSNYARTSKSELLRYIERGGDLRALDVETVTKRTLRATTAAPESTDKRERQVNRAQGSLLRALRRQAKTDPDQARLACSAALAALQEVLDAIEETDTDKKSVRTTTVSNSSRTSGGHRRTRVGEPLLNRGA